MGTTLQLQRVKERLDIVSRRLHNAHHKLTESLDRLAGDTVTGPEQQLRESAKEMTGAAEALEAELAEVREMLDAQNHRIEELDHEMEQVRRLVMVDGLTGALNRNAFSRHLDTQISQSRRFQTPLTMLILDIDHLQDVNDKHGMAAGDELLSSFSSLIRRSIREYDVLFRIGGDRFAVLFPNGDLSHGRVSADRITSTVENKTFRHNNARFKISFSAGVAQYAGDEEWDCFLRRAENLVWRAKEGGRSQTHHEGPA